jgi:hypothetical protein
MKFWFFTARSIFPSAHLRFLIFRFVSHAPSCMRACTGGAGLHDDDVSAVRAAGRGHANALPRPVRVHAHRRAGILRQQSVAASLLTFERCRFFGSARFFFAQILLADFFSLIFRPFILRSNIFFSLSLSLIRSFTHPFFAISFYLLAISLTIFVSCPPLFAADCPGDHHHPGARRVAGTCVVRWQAKNSARQIASLLIVTFFTLMQ